MSLDEARAAVDFAGAAADLGGTLLPPVDSQEVWAAGVTYERSRDGRIEESTEAGVYDRVYVARRPEVFFKATAQRVVGDGQPVGVRADSPWNAPEPELGLVLNAAGEIFGYVVGNDVSSRSIEGENPLYLPQAKVYDRSCSLGPGIVPVWAAPALPFDIGLRVQRGDAVAYEESTSTASITRRFEDLAAWLTAALTFPVGVVLLTGRASCRTSRSASGRRRRHHRHSRYRHAHQPGRPRRPGSRPGAPMTAPSAGEGVLRGAARAGVVAEHGTRIRLLGRAEALPGRGDVSIRRLGPPESAAPSPGAARPRGRPTGVRTVSPAPAPLQTVGDGHLAQDHCRDR